MARAVLAVEGGFVDPVFDAQAIFRSLMQALAEPGAIAEFGTRVTGPESLVPAAAAILASLADGDTPVWLPEPTGMDEAARLWLRFQTGAPIAIDPALATFAALRQGHDPAAWTGFALGTPAYPDRSATLLLPVRSLAGGAPLVLTGPGIETERTIRPVGLPAGFLPAMAENRSRFPLGFDLVLVCGTEALALPRTTHIREG